MGRRHLLNLRSVVLSFIAAPALVFYILLARTVVNIPFFDDYESVLRFLNVFSQLHGVWARVAWILSFQHVEYRLVFESAVFGATYLLLGHANFILLCLIGDALVVALFFVVLAIWNPQNGSGARPLLYIAPVAFLIFQLQYASTLNWAMGALQNFPALLFSFLAIYLIARGDRRSYLSACLSLMLAVASSGNGFLVAPVGVVMLLQARKQWRVLAWIIISATLAVAYHHGYDTALSQDRALGGVPHGFSIRYALSFLGSSAARFNSTLPSAVLGAGLCVVLLRATWRRYYRRNAAVFYCLALLVATAFGVSYLRSGEGLEQSLASRYRIYSNLGLVFTYMYGMDELGAMERKGAAQRAMLVSALCGSVLFCIFSDVAGYRLLRERQTALVLEMAAWQSGSPDLELEIAKQLQNPSVERNLRQGIYRPIVATLEQSIMLGVYSPPVLHDASVHETETGPTITPDKRDARPQRCK